MWRPPLSSWLSAQAAFVKCLQVGLPYALTICAKLIKVRPAKYARVVHVVEMDSDRVVTDRFQTGLCRHDAVQKIIFFSFDECPCTSADGLSTRNNSAGSENVDPSSKSISRLFSAFLRRISEGQRSLPPMLSGVLLPGLAITNRRRRRPTCGPRRPALSGCRRESDKRGWPAR